MLKLFIVLTFDKCMAQHHCCVAPVKFQSDYSSLNHSFETWWHLTIMKPLSAQGNKALSYFWNFKSLGRMYIEQGKSEGFESCDRPIVRKHPIWVKIDDVLSRVTLKFDGWPWKTLGHLSFAVSSFVQHFIAIGEFKLELQSGNAQFGSNSTILRAVWPWNLTYDLEKQ